MTVGESRLYAPAYQRASCLKSMSTCHKIQPRGASRDEAVAIFVLLHRSAIRNRHARIRRPVFLVILSRDGSLCRQLPVLHPSRPDNRCQCASCSLFILRQFRCPTGLLLVLAGGCRDEPWSPLPLAACGCFVPRACVSAANTSGSRQQVSEKVLRRIDRWYFQKNPGSPDP